MMMNKKNFIYNIYYQKFKKTNYRNLETKNL
jgi:hypothetical protein